MKSSISPSASMKASICNKTATMKTSSTTTITFATTKNEELGAAMDFFADLYRKATELKIAGADLGSDFDKAIRGLKVIIRNAEAATYDRIEAQYGEE